MQLLSVSDAARAYLAARLDTKNFRRRGPARFAAVGPLRRLLTAALVIACFGLLAPRASAVVVINADSTANNGQISDPGTGIPYANVGVSPSGNGSAVYLGNGWAIMNEHESASIGEQLTFGSNTYTIDQTPQQVMNAANAPGQPNSGTDLQLVHLSTTPSLPNVNVANLTTLTTLNTIDQNGNSNASYNLPSGSIQNDVVMIGKGANIDTSQSSSPQTYVNSFTYQGFPLTNYTSAEPRWGTNVVEEGTYSDLTHGLGHAGTLTQMINSSNDATYYEYTFATMFGNTPTASNQEAQGTPGDSGGGVFQEINGTWYLVGLMDEMLGAAPSGYVYLNSSQSLIADLFDYGSSIQQVTGIGTPEPSGLVLGCIGVGALVVAAGRRQRAAKAR